MTPISSQAHITRCALAVKYFMQGFLLWATESGWVPGDRGGRELCAVFRAAGVQARQEVLGGRCCWLTAAPSSSSGCPGRAALIPPQAAAPEAFLSLVPICSPVPPANKWVWSQPPCSGPVRCEPCPSLRAKPGLIKLNEGSGGDGLKAWKITEVLQHGGALSAH